MKINLLLTERQKQTLQDAPLSPPPLYFLWFSEVTFKVVTSSAELRLKEKQNFNPQDVHINLQCTSRRTGSDGRGRVLMINNKSWVHVNLCDPSSPGVISCFVSLCVLRCVYVEPLINKANLSCKISNNTKKR